MKRLATGLAAALLASSGVAGAQASRDVALGAVTLTVPAEWRHACTRPVEGFELHTLHHPDGSRLLFAHRAGHPAAFEHAPRLVTPQLARRVANPDLDRIDVRRGALQSSEILLDARPADPSKVRVVYEDLPPAKRTAVDRVLRTARPTPAASRAAVSCPSS